MKNQTNHLSEMYLCMNCMKEISPDKAVMNKYKELFCSEDCVSEFEKEEEKLKDLTVNLKLI